MLSTSGSPSIDSHGIEHIHAEDVVYNHTILMTYYTRQHGETMLFLGAGASVFAGMPTTKGLIRDVLQQVLPQEKWKSPQAASLVRNIVRHHEGQDVEVLYQTIRRMTDAEKLHEEAMKHKMAGDNNPAWKREILTTSAYGSDIENKKNETEDIAENIDTFESLEVAIRNTLLDRLMVKRDYITAVVEQYDGLFEHVPRNIATTNYDNVLETYCERKKLDMVNGFKPSHLGDRRIWKGEHDGAWAVGEDALRLVKLHGSIAWQEDGDDILEIGRPGMRDTTRDVMIAPTLGEKDYDSKIFPTLWKRFEAILAETELLIVAGFSFRDPKINRMFRSRLKRTAENPMKLLYIDPRHRGLKELVGTDVELLQARARRGALLHYYHDEMPYVYAYNVEFPLIPNELEASIFGSA